MTNEFSGRLNGSRADSGRDHLVRPALWILAAGMAATFGVPAGWAAEPTAAEMQSATPVDSNSKAGEELPTIAVAAPEASAQPEAVRGPSKNRVIEEIVVTAQKREENLKDVPISVAAFSGDKLEALGVSDPSELQRVTPGLTYASQIGYAIIFIRGLGSDAYLPSADTSVATYVDGVYFPFAQNLASQFTKLERVEVLKGPQGTLFGRNSTAGAINIISKEPSDIFEGSVDGTLGNFGKKTAKLFVTGPVLNDVSVSLSMLYDRMDSYHKFVDYSPIQKAKPEETFGANLRVRWNIAEDLSLLISGYRLRYEGAGLGMHRLEQITPLGYAVGGRNIDEPYAVATNVDTLLKNHNDVGYGTLKWTPDLFDVKLSGSYQEVSTGTAFDFDSTAWNVAYLDGKGQGARTITSELQFTSTPDGLFGSWLEWTGGYYFYKNKGGFSNLLFDIVSIDPDAAGSLPVSALTLALAPVDAALEALGLPSLAGGAATLSLRGMVQTEAHAAYAQGTWRPTDWFGLTVGGRYQIEDRRTDAASTSVVLDDLPPVTVFNHPLKKKINKVFSPKVTADFHPFGDDTMLYLSWQKANKSGTFNVISLYYPPAYIKPEKITAVEAGIKGTLLDHAFSYNLAAFHYTVKDLQTIVVSATSGGIAQLLNVPESEIYGMDFDIVWQLMPDLVPGLVGTISGAWLPKHEFTDYKDGAGFDPVTGLYYGPGELVPRGPVDYTGKKTPRAPDSSCVVGLSYTFDVPGGNVEIGGDVNYSGSFYYDAQNVTSQNAYTLYNARASYLYEPWNLRLTAFGKNLSDKVYYANKLPLDFGVASTFAAPRMYGLTVGYEF